MRLIIRVFFFLLFCSCEVKDLQTYDLTYISVSKYKSTIENNKLDLDCSKMYQGYSYYARFEPVDYLLLNAYDELIVQNDMIGDQKKYYEIKQEYQETCNFRVYIQGTELRETLSEYNSVALTSFFAFENKKHFMLLTGNDTLPTLYYQFNILEFKPSVTFLVSFACIGELNNDLKLIYYDKVLSGDTMTFDFKRVDINKIPKILTYE